MAYESSINCVLQVENVGGTAYTTVGGQSDTSLDLTANRISTSNKSTGVWETSLGGKRNFGIDVSGFINWPDTEGYERLRTVATAGTDIDARIILDFGGKHYDAATQVNQFRITAPDNNATGYQFGLGLSQGTPIYAATLP